MNVFRMENDRHESSFAQFVAERLEDISEIRGETIVADQNGDISSLLPIPEAPGGVEDLPPGLRGDPRRGGGKDSGNRGDGVSCFLCNVGQSAGMHSRFPSSFPEYSSEGK